jgi:hypothetical protein
MTSPYKVVFFHFSFMCSVGQPFLRIIIVGDITFHQFLICALTKEMNTKNSGFWIMSGSKIIALLYG